MLAHAVVRLAQFTIWFALATGLVIATNVSLLVVVTELVENPSGIFRDEQGWHWNLVWDLAVSWFVPTFAIAATVGAGVGLVLGLVLRLRGGPPKAERDRPL